ncbi:phBC6A51 family helix-turn-helix protein [Piscibacillus sp. B03]|uniref:phBC6A51 family helix-turn-helix protein n=1 Tax=Piscibacillus sp. B03 TaxID=3457430 RepID=UPI003FCD5AF0
MAEIDERIEKIEPDSSLKERQIRLAKAFVKDTHELGLGVTDFTKKYNVSTKTWYEWLKNPKFERYINDLKGHIISDDEKEAYHIVKKKIMANATKRDASPKEIEQFLDTFEYVVQAEKMEAMKKLGINPDTNNSSDARTLEQKKLGLLDRLKPAEPQEETEELEGNE